MVTDARPVDSPMRPSEGQLPPIAEVTVVSMALIVVGGIYLASYLPKPPSLAPAVGLLVASVAVLAWVLLSLSRLRDFAWDRFFLVARWTLLAYVVIAGMLEYVFVVDHTRGGTLAVLTTMLVVYAVDVPLILSFSVARYAGPARSGVPAEE